MSNAALLKVYDGQEPDLCFGAAPGPGGVNSVGVGLGLVNTGTSPNPVVSLGMSAVGDLLVGTGVANSGAVLPKGADGNFLRVKPDGTGLEYVAVVPGGGVNSVSAAPNNVGYVNNTSPDTPQIGIAFAAAGDLVVGTGANQGTILQKGADGNFLRVKPDGSGLEYAAVAPGGVDSVSVLATNPLVVSTTAPASATDPKIGIAFAAKGDLVVGTGVNTGLILTAPLVADLVLTSAPGEASGLKWEASGSGSSATIFRNNTSTALPITKPSTANDTCVIVSDEVFGTPINTQVYDQQAQSGTTDILTNPAFYDWAIGPGEVITTDALINLIVLDMEITASAAPTSASMELIGPLPATTTLGTFTFQPPVIPVGTNLVQTSYSGPNILLTSGETYQLKLLITPANPGDTFTWRGTALSDYAGFFSVEGTGKGGGPAQFACPVGSSFRLPGVSTTHPLATCDTYSSQSFVASASLLDWILVGGLNSGVLIP